MSSSSRVPPQFVDDFELVAKHYKLKEMGEYDLAKDVARQDIEQAIIAFASVAAQIRSTEGT